MYYAQHCEMLCIVHCEKKHRESRMQWVGCLKTGLADQGTGPEMNEPHVCTKQSMVGGKEVKVLCMHEGFILRLRKTAPSSC